MYTTTGEKLTWAEFEARREKGEEIFIGNYPKEDQNNFVKFAHSHTMKETENAHFVSFEDEINRYRSTNDTYKNETAATADDLLNQFNNK